MHKFRAQLDWHGQPRIAHREDSATDSLSCFEDRDVDVRVVKQTRRFQAGDARADDCHLDRAALHRSRFSVFACQRDDIAARSSSCRGI
jgi:hypothetical protein